MARSTTKLIQESPLVARHAYERIKGYFELKGLVSPRILIVGLGPIGEAMREVFTENGFAVSGFDIKDGHRNIMEVIKEAAPDVIIGAVGSQILSKDDIGLLDPSKSLYLISMSSSDREFPVSFFRNGEGDHDDVIHENIVFVNNGFPISFKGNRYELTPMEMEKTICLLGGSVAYGVINGYHGNGIVPVPEEIEKMIN